MENMLAWVISYLFTFSLLRLFQGWILGDIYVKYIIFEVIILGINYGIVMQTYGDIYMFGSNLIFHSIIQSILLFWPIGYLFLKKRYLQNKHPKLANEYFFVWEILLIEAGILISLAIYNLISSMV